MAERRGVAITVAAMTIVLLSGCAGGQPPQEEETVDITTATQELHDELDALQEQFGGGWEVQDLAAPLDCADRDGSASRATRYGTPTGDGDLVYADAKERWTSEGYVIEERTDPDGSQRLFATRDDGAFRQIALGSNSIMLQGTTACLPDED